MGDFLVGYLIAGVIASAGIPLVACRDDRYRDLGSRVIAIAMLLTVLFWMPTWLWVEWENWNDG